MHRPMIRMNAPAIGQPHAIAAGPPLFQPTPNVVNYVPTGSCLVEYNRISNGMRLIDDPGTGWLGPLIGVPAGPGGGILSNSYCTLDTTQSGARFSGATMYVDAKVTFKSSLSRVFTWSREPSTR